MSLRPLLRRPSSLQPPLRRPLRLALGAALLASMLTACQTQPLAPTSQTAQAAPVEPIIQTYAVPDGQQNKIVSVLRKLMGTGAEASGRVSQAPGNRVVVAAPPGLQKSVGLFIDDLAANTPETSLPKALAFDYWLVMGKSATETDTSRVRGLATTLDAIAEAEGPTAFQLIEKVSTLSLDSEPAEVKGQWLKVHHTASVQNNTLFAHLDLETPGNSQLRTVVQLTPGQTLVLGQMGFEQERAQTFDTGEKTPDDQYKLYIVIRAAIR